MATNLFIYLFNHFHHSRETGCGGGRTKEQGIQIKCAPFTLPTMIYHRRQTTTPGTSCPTLSDKRVGFFYVPQDYKQWSVVRRGPHVQFYRPYPKRIESLTICGRNYKGSTYSLVVLRPWVLVQPELNSRPPVDIPVLNQLSHRCAVVRVIKLQRDW